MWSAWGKHLLQVIGDCSWFLLVLWGGERGAFLPFFSLQLTTSSSDFYLSWEHVSKHLWRALFLWCWGFCAAKVAFSSTAPRLFSYQFLLGVLVLPCEVCGRRGTEVGALVTIKQCSAILVKTIFLIVTYSGDLVALPACLDHQKCMKQGSCDIWAYERTLLKSSKTWLIFCPIWLLKAASRQKEIRYIRVCPVISILNRSVRVCHDGVCGGGLIMY